MVVCTCLLLSQAGRVVDEEKGVGTGAPLRRYGAHPRRKRLPDGGPSAEVRSGIHRGTVAIRGALCGGTVWRQAEARVRTVRSRVCLLALVARAEEGLDRLRYLSAGQRSTAHLACDCLRLRQGEGRGRHGICRLNLLALGAGSHGIGRLYFLTLVARMGQDLDRLHSLLTGQRSTAHLASDCLRLGQGVERGSMASVA